MDAISYSNARKNFAETMERVCDEHEPIIITRSNAASVVMMSLEDFNSIQETDYLLRNSANAENLRASIKQYEEGKYQRRDIIDE
jgi:antitoxin YefM